MKDYKKLVENALKKATDNQSNEKKKLTLNESVVYPEGISERMHPTLEDDLAQRKHSLGVHPTFPDDGESTFEQRIMGKRFDEVTKRYKRAFDVDNIDNTALLSQMMPMVHETMAIESKNKKELEELAVRMIREEYDMDEDAVEIVAEITPKINMSGTKKTAKEVDETIFENHDELMRANDEVKKRRLLNAMTQGAAKKCNHMYHMVDEELTDLDPRLPNKYAKMMAAADYMYYVIPQMENGVNGGVVRVQFPNANNPKAVIHAQAMVFPVLIHELVKGVMELLSAHGLPKDAKTGNYVVDKADNLEAEPWDMRMGPALWGKFTEAIDVDDFPLKHHIYSELAALPVHEFNSTMREIMAGTAEGKKAIKLIVDGVRAGLQEDEFNQAMTEIDTYGDEPEEPEVNTDDNGFDFEQLFGINGNPLDDNEDSDEGFEFDDLL